MTKAARMHLLAAFYMDNYIRKGGDHDSQYFIFYDYNKKKKTEQGRSHSS
jgi:hypothetical protein